MVHSYGPWCARPGAADRTCDDQGEMAKLVQCEPAILCSTDAFCSTRAGGVGLIWRDAFRSDTFGAPQKAARSNPFSPAGVRSRAYPALSRPSIASGVDRTGGALRHHFWSAPEPGTSGTDAQNTVGVAGKGTMDDAR
jgi:hypothetical protein